MTIEGVTREEYREPAACPICGEEHLECSEAILDGMALNARFAAEKELSAEGKEVLRMVSHAVNTLGLEAYDLAVARIPTPSRNPPPTVM